MQEDFTLFLTVALLQIYSSSQTDTFRLNLDKVLFPTHIFYTFRFAWILRTVSVYIRFCDNHRFML